MTVHVLGDAPLGLGAIEAAARPGVRLVLSEAARSRVAAARAVVERYAAGDEPVYGLNTGLGGNLGYRLTPQEVEAFQVQMVRGRSIGVGEPFPEPVARLMLLCRIVGLARGGSGLSPAVLDLLVAMFDAGITPVIPGRGSIGAADLGLCAHIGLAAIGRGEVFVGGSRRPAAEALAAAGLAPARLGPKDGLAILNSSAVCCGHAVAVLRDWADLALLSAAVAALSCEGYAANPRIFDARLAAARPARGQEGAAALFRALLDGSALHLPGAARSIQDALSFRTLAPVVGAALAAFAAAAESVETEVNAAADNPLVLADDGLILSTANFHTPGIALAFDALAIAGAHLATGTAWRAAKLLDPRLSGLPRYLSPVGGASTGFNSLGKTAAALHAEVRLRAAPASLDALPVSDGVEDHAPQTPLTVRKLAEQVEALRMLVAIEALVAAQAVDLRAPPHLAPVARVLHGAIRAAVPRLDEDRETGPDVDRITALLRGPDLVGALRGALGEVAAQTFDLRGEPA
ncbi:HAL/PAL/TAL family ammonia-lyase [Lichenibacterium dinghuense]|uniref:HAL/PAL/TAL family ammonia-lyase n=1 Tax=Lichenibacterium dinghuense TaxID=2895977 RepID=UPI001F42656C|nr:aromatic amino acid lyase [Lichenibacterium sp. 6Y81]